MSPHFWYTVPVGELSSTQSVAEGRRRQGGSRERQLRCKKNAVTKDDTVDHSFTCAAVMKPCTDQCIRSPLSMQSHGMQSFMHTLSDRVALLNLGDVMHNTSVSTQHDASATRTLLKSDPSSPTKLQRTPRRLLEFDVGHADAS